MGVGVGAGVVGATLAGVAEAGAAVGVALARGVSVARDTDAHEARTVARSRGRAYAVDLFTGSAALVSTITVSADGFHPSDEGYRLIAERFAGAMRASGVPLRP